MQANWFLRDEETIGDEEAKQIAQELTTNGTLYVELRYKDIGNDVRRRSRMLWSPTRH
jgi:hypothetical protein